MAWKSHRPSEEFRNPVFFLTELFGCIPALRDLWSKWAEQIFPKEWDKHGYFQTCPVLSAITSNTWTAYSFPKSY